MTGRRGTGWIEGERRGEVREDERCGGESDEGKEGEETVHRKSTKRRNKRGEGLEKYRG